MLNGNNKSITHNGCCQNPSFTWLPLNTFIMVIVTVQIESGKSLHDITNLNCSVYCQSKYSTAGVSNYCFRTVCSLVSFRSLSLPVSGPVSSQSMPVAMSLLVWPAVSQVIHHHRWRFIIGPTPWAHRSWQIRFKCQPSAGCSDWFWHAQRVFCQLHAPWTTKTRCRQLCVCACVRVCAFLFYNIQHLLLGGHASHFFTRVHLTQQDTVKRSAKSVCVCVCSCTCVSRRAVAFAPKCSFSAFLLKTQPS